MRLAYSLLIYLVTLILVCFIFFCGLRLTFWGSFSLGILVAVIVLLLLTPPASIDRESHPNLVLLYILLVLASAAVLLLYFLSRALFDFRDKICHRP